MARGRALFLGSGCDACHRLGWGDEVLAAGRGGGDLTGIGWRRSMSSIVRSLVSPAPRAGPAVHRPPLSLSRPQVLELALFLADRGGVPDPARAEGALAAWAAEFPLAAAERHREAGRWDEALDAYRMEVARDPTGWAAWDGMVRTLDDAGLARPDRGLRVYEARCAACHGPARPPVGPPPRPGGPPLEGAHARLGQEGLVRAVVRPSEEVERRWVATEVVLVDGEHIQGLELGEEAGRLLFQVYRDGRLQVLELAPEDVARLLAPEGSFMPEGLGAGLGPRALADLLAWLRTY